MKEKILALRAEGKSYLQIKEELGCSLGTISYHLGEGQKEKNVARYRVLRKSRRDIISEMKNKPCADCGVSYPSYVMDFDHLGDKEFEISSNISRKKMEDLVLEIAKCDVVCSNCHRIRTWQRRQ